jgi:Lipocalin-like domain
MRTCTTALCAAALLTLLATPAAAAPAFIGKWKAQSMEAKGKTQPIPKGLSVQIEFKKGGEFIATMTVEGKDKPKTKVEKGAWKAKGKTLTTIAKKTETMNYKVKGKKLILEKQDKFNSKMYLTRVK